MRCDIFVSSSDQIPGSDIHLLGVDGSTPYQLATSALAIMCTACVHMVTTYSDKSIAVIKSAKEDILMMRSFGNCVLQTLVAVSASCIAAGSLPHSIRSESL